MVTKKISSIQWPQTGVICFLLFNSFNVSTWSQHGLCSPRFHMKVQADGGFTTQDTCYSDIARCSRKRTRRFHNGSSWFTPCHTTCHTYAINFEVIIPNFRGREHNQPYHGPERDNGKVAVLWSDYHDGAAVSLLILQVG